MKNTHLIKVDLTTNMGCMLEMERGEMSLCPDPKNARKVEWKGESDLSCLDPFYKWWEGPPSALWATRSCSCLIQRLIRPDSFSCWILVLNLDQVNHLIERHVIWTSLYMVSPFEEHKPHQRGKGNPGKKIRVPSFMIYVQSWQSF